MGCAQVDIGDLGGFVVGGDHPAVIFLLQFGDAADMVVMVVTGDILSNALGLNFWMGAFVKAVQIDIIEMAYASATNEHPDALITQGDNALNIYTLADPVKPDKVGAIPFDGSGPMVTSGNSVWIGTPETMTRMDITSISAPILETTTMHVIAPQQVSAANGKVVVADRYSIRVFGPQTPAPPPPTDRHRSVSH